jgi:DNA-binding NarL/FixJ family response regulator
VVGVARSGLETVAAAGWLRPRILLLDLSIARGNDLALLPLVLRKSPRTRVILLTRRSAPARILSALGQGAQGYLDPRSLRVFLPKAVRAVDAGEAWVPRKMVAKIIECLARLTPRAEAPDSLLVSPKPFQPPGPLARRRARLNRREASRKDSEVLTLCKMSQFGK